MKIVQEIFTKDSGWKNVFQNGSVTNPQLVLVFGNREIVSHDLIYNDLKSKYPNADIIISSTAGEIVNTGFTDNSIVATIIEFEHTQLTTCQVNISDFDNSYAAATQIVSTLCQKELNHVFIVADGQLINGSELVNGLNQFKDKKVLTTGGLAGDEYEFNETLVGLNNVPSKGNIVAIGFYGDRLKVGFGSKGGWDSFGPERLITKSKGNVLYELDNQNALDLYKKYLGEAANELPSSALFFPLSIKAEGTEELLVRTILSICEETKSMTFAGNMPEGTMAQMMKHNADRLIGGAEQAAENCIKAEDKEPELAILISCVGRRIVLGQNIDEEIEVIRGQFGDKTILTGFYSYGEIAPFNNLSRCELHNQTMTITTLSEV
ncbi:MAG: FIST signal transduction protein [Saprospiraceae bacterium]